MRKAIQLGFTRRGQTWPNPPVGAVIVKEGVSIGTGSHPGPGEPHAEVMALREADRQARGATLYVTLEPCSHYGRTPPCTEAIIQAGIQRVVAAIPDPNPHVRGQGLQTLLAAGIEVTVGVEAEAAVELAEPYLSLASRGRPWVVYKAGVSLDGKTATHQGSSRWITGEVARKHVHRLRAQLPAIMVGIGTVLADNPRLTVRDGMDLQDIRQPTRIVVDGHARTPPDARMLQQPGTTLIACQDQADPGRVAALQQAGAEIVPLPPDPTDEGRVDLKALMQELGRRQVTGVFLEGGGRLAAALLEAHLIDEIIMHIAPLLIGGEGAPGPFGGRGIKHINEKIPLAQWEWQPLGSDMQVRATFRSLVHRSLHYFRFFSKSGNSSSGRADATH